MAARIVYRYDNNKYEVGEIITPKRESFGMPTDIEKQAETLIPSARSSDSSRMSVIDPAPAFAVPNARELRWPVMFGDAQQCLHRGLPFPGIVLCPGQLGNVLRGVAERDQ
jgi:hypothetical protein